MGKDYAGLDALDTLLTPVVKNMLERVSTRAFTPDPVPREVIGILLEALRAAPTAGNLQSVHAILIEDPKRRERIARIAYHQEWIAEAPSLLVLTTNTRVVEETYEGMGVWYGVQDAAIAGMSILLAAQSLGYASCYVGAFDEEALRDELSLPEHVKPVVILPLGKPAFTPDKPPRKPPEQFISFETFGARPPRSIFKGSLEVKRIVQEEASRLLPPLHEKLGRLAGRLALSEAQRILEERARELEALREELRSLRLAVREAEAARALAERKAAWQTGPWSYHVLKALKQHEPPFTRSMLRDALKTISFKGYRIEALLPYLPPRISSRRDVLKALKHALERVTHEHAEKEDERKEKNTPLSGKKRKNR